MRSKSVLLCSVLFGIFFLAASASASDGPELIDQASSAYQAGRFDQAVDLYRQALSKRGENGHLFYNLGNSLYRLGRFGESIAAYRRAMRLLPRDPDVQSNLTLARKEAVDRIDDVPAALDQIVAQVYPPLAPLTMRLISMSLWLAAWGLLSFARRGRAMGIALLLISVLWGMLTFGTQPGRDGTPRIAVTEDARRQNPAVLIAEKADLYSGDNDSYQVVFALHEGAEVMTATVRGEWIEVVLPEGRKGWLKRDNLDILSE